MLFSPLQKYDLVHSYQHARNAYTQIRQALLAYNTDGNEMRSVFTIVSSRSQARDINELYKINPIEVLGSGQFGTVYGGKTTSHRRSRTSFLFKDIRWKRMNKWLLK